MRSSLFVLLIVGIILLNLVIILVFSMKTYDTVLEYKAHMVVEEGSTVGLNVNNDQLYFGRIPPGGGGSREMLIKNHLPWQTVVEFKGRGSIAPYLLLPKGDLLQAGEERTVAIAVAVPRGTPAGNYTGSVLLSFKR